MSDIALANEVPRGTVGTGSDVEVDVDHHGPEFRDSVYEVFDDLRGRCPVAHSSAHDGFWMLTDYESVFAATRDDEAFSSADSVAVPGSPFPFPILPIETDPPETQQLRAVTLGPFSPKAAKDLRPVMREIATDLIDRFIERGECDIVAEFATPMPARVMLRMLDFDESRYLEWVDRVHVSVHERAHDPEAAIMAGASMLTELAEEMDKRRQRPADADLFSRIVHGELDGEPLDEVQISMYGLLMMLGGMDTTSGLTGNALLQLCDHPELRQQLIDDPSILAAATEEFLRHDTPTLGLGRTTTRDVEVGGCLIPKGEKVLLMWAAANRDPAVFENPNELDFTRENRRHLSFGVGAHRCLGSNLAREMFKVMLEEMLRRLPDFELAGEPVRYEDAAEVYGLSSLPIRFTPGPRSTA